MTLMQGEEWDKPLEVLQAGDNLTKVALGFEKTPLKRVQVLNNLGCLYRRLKQEEKSLDYLHKALQLCTQHRISSAFGITHLNICAV